MKANLHNYPWVPDQGDGTYWNPILFADYSDPDVVRVGSDFYLIASSFNCVPGLPILHSHDLVNWTLVNHALRELPHPRYAEVQHGQGVWAPAIRHYGGRFWIFFPTPDEGIYVTTAEDPLGAWSKPHLLLGGKGLIDPCPLWDDDGSAYLAHAYAGSRAGIRNKLHMRPMSACGTKILGDGEIVAEINPRLPALEGPKLHKRDGWYYISAPSGGVSTGWQVIFRSRNIYGPYEQKVVLAQRGTEINGPHQGSLVDTADGEWWFLHFQDRDAYGRVVHLQPVRWEDDWPLIGANQDEEGTGMPVKVWHKPRVSVGTSAAIPETTDEFDREKLGLQWQWHANAATEWCSLTEQRGFLRLKAQFVVNGDLLKAPNLLLQKFPAETFMLETRLKLPNSALDLQAGLVVFGSSYAALVVSRHDDGYLVRLKADNEGGECLMINDPLVTLRVMVGRGAVCRFGVANADGDFYQIGPAFVARPGKWIGAKVGLFCVSTNPTRITGHADFAYFRFSPCLEPAGGRDESLEREAKPGEINA